MLTAVTTPVMVVTTSMVPVIMAVTPDGREVTVTMVMEILYI